MSRVRIVAASLAATAFATACYSPPVQAPTTQVTQETPIRVSQNAQNKVDILFMVDNSLSMDAMQTELRARFGDFLSVFDKLGDRKLYPDLHIGVVTSDYGAGDKAKMGGCSASPGGDGGLLQARGAAAPASCAVPVGARYISYAYGPTAATHNLPAGQSLQETFTCMASVGSNGCGFEHQLESVYAALRNGNENKGFLRDDALLAVVFVTNEDDGSAPPSATIYEDDGGAHGAYDTFRQTRYAVACGSPDPGLPAYGPSNGPLTNCGPAPNTPTAHLGEAYDVSRYIDLFTKPPQRGGLKRSKEDVIVVGIDGKDPRFEVILAENNTGGGAGAHPEYVPCAAVGPNCLVRLQHSCQNQVQKAFFADPAIRINRVIDTVNPDQVFSICGDDLSKTPDFSRALTSVAERIGGLLSPGCIPAPLTNAASPDCTVEDFTTDDSGVDHVSVIPRCDLAPGALPCWRVEEKAACVTQSPQSLGVTIDRGGHDAPPETTARVFCSTVAR